MPHLLESTLGGRKQNEVSQRRDPWYPESLHRASLLANGLKMKLKEAQASNATLADFHSR